MNPEDEDEFEKYFWKDNTYKSVSLHPDRNLTKELKIGKFSLHTLKRIKAQNEAQPVSGVTDEQLENECTICIMEIEQPYRVDCKHKYCVDCAFNLMKIKMDDEFKCCVCLPPGSSSKAGLIGGASSKKGKKKKKKKE